MGLYADGIIPSLLSFLRNTTLAFFHMTENRPLRRILLYILTIVSGIASDMCLRVSTRFYIRSGPGAFLVFISWTSSRTSSVTTGEIWPGVKHVHTTIS